MKFKSFKNVKICLMIKIKFFAEKNFSVKILFCNHYLSPLNICMRKGKKPDPYMCCD
jgi:hypothetical protein